MKVIEISKELRLIKDEKNGCLMLDRGQDGLCHFEISEVDKLVEALKLLTEKNE